jgi:hypothetical protein
MRDRSQTFAISAIRQDLIKAFPSLLLLRGAIAAARSPREFYPYLPPNTSRCPMRYSVIPVLYGVHDARYIRRFFGTLASMRKVSANFASERHAAPSNVNLDCFLVAQPGGIFNKSPASPGLASSSCPLPRPSPLPPPPCLMKYHGVIYGVSNWQHIRMCARAHMFATWGTRGGGFRG